MAYDKHRTVLSNRVGPVKQYEPYFSGSDACGNTAMECRHAMLGERGYAKSMDGGERWTFHAADGLPIYEWDARGHRLHTEYDALRRPTRQWLGIDGGAETLIGETVYGESAPSPEAGNLRGKPWKVYDQSGTIENSAYDFKGNLLESRRRFAKEYRQAIDWSQNVPLEDEEFISATAYDALNRATSLLTPCSASIPASEIMPGYDEGGLLKTVRARLRGAMQETDFVTEISYNPKGQRERIRYGNGATTKYEYDEKTFRLARLLTTRSNGTDVLQDLSYEYDQTGNITGIADNAQQTIYFSGQFISPSQTFEYDALYRLTEATGREHVSNGAGTEPEDGGYPHTSTPMPGDGTALRRYTREWEYDQAGNILKMVHQANNGNWSRLYDYAADSNRLYSTTVGQATVNYAYNQHGSMASMPHLQSMDWDFMERLSHITRGTTEAYYNYDSGGQRTRKVVEKGNVVEERLYLGGFEIWRKKVNGNIETERETLHIMDDVKRIVVVETKTVDNGIAVSNPNSAQRYQLSNNIESATLELDENASIISYEEYYPYGDTSYRAGRNIAETGLKRYRYTGKEKDEESGMYYMLARYYAGWLGRWTSANPAGLVDGPNLYAYCRGNPVGLVDPSGTQTDDVTWDVPKNVQTEEDFREWIFNKEGVYINGDVTIERTKDGNPIFNYNEADFIKHKDAGTNILTEKSQRTFGSYLPGTSASEESLEFYVNLIMEGERQGGLSGFLKQTAGYTGGLFSALWTSETATNTMLTVGSAGVGSLAPAGSLIGKGLQLWGGYESGVAVTEGITGTTSGVHMADIGKWVWSGQYQGGQKMSNFNRGINIGLGGLGLGVVGRSTNVLKTNSEGFLYRGFEINTPLNIPVQRFGSMSIVNENPWGLRMGTSLLANRGFAAIKSEWNLLTLYTTGVIPKGTPIKLGIIGPQNIKHFGGSLQFNVESRKVLWQTSRIIDR